MRCTVGTIGTAAALLLFITAFWPATPHNGIAVKAVAENPVAAAPPLERPADAPQRDAVMPPGEKWGFLRPDRASEKILAALDKPTEVSFVDLPLQDALAYLKDYHNINVWIDRPALADEGIQLDSPITLQHTDVSLRSTLKLMFADLGLTYVVEDEMLKITTPKKATNVIAVYNIREMVGPQAALLGSGGAVEHLNRPLPPRLANPDDEDVPVTKGAAASAKPVTAPRRSGPSAQLFYTSSLAELVTRTIAPDTWIEAGGDGSAIQYNGVLVIRNSQVVHEQVRGFLKLLRSTLDAAPQYRDEGS